MPRRLREFYYIAHIQNLPSILKEGILSHAEIERRGIQPVTVYDRGIVAWRQQKKTPAGLSLWEYANLYFNARNPMLYRLLIEHKAADIVVLGVRKQVLGTEGAFVTTGNAARSESEIIPRGKWRDRAAEILKGVDVEWWSEADGSKRRIMAEALIPRYVPPEMIDTVYVANDEARDRALELLRGRVSPLPSIVPQPYMFFIPTRMYRITPTLQLVSGDMFFSKMQTLTISVNTVGVMGKGLASRAKYQFPDAYVVYQDACRRKEIAPGRPYLYKREASLDVALADDTFPLPPMNRRTWFLFFPTKRHWRHRSRIEDIEAGLDWIARHYRQEGIGSLALPALGCGLGGLEWAEVGPLMCRYLSRLDIPVHIHLPLERDLPEEQLRPEFLLASESDQDG